MDKLVAGNGNNQLHAGPGHDSLTSGDGNNIFVDPFGHTSLQGGSGHNTYILIDFRLDPHNNFDPSKDRIKKYQPPSSPNSTQQLLNNLLNDYFGNGLF